MDFSCIIDSCISNATNIYKNDKNSHNRLIENAMNQDIDWKMSADKYLKLYEEIRA